MKPPEGEHRPDVRLRALLVVVGASSIFRTVWSRVSNKYLPTYLGTRIHDILHTTWSHTLTAAICGPYICWWFVCFRALCWV